MSVETLYHNIEGVAFVDPVPAQLLKDVMNAATVSVVTFGLEEYKGMFVRHVIVNVGKNGIHLNQVFAVVKTVDASQPRQDSLLKMENLSQCLNCK